MVCYSAFRLFRLSKAEKRGDLLKGRAGGGSRQTARRNFRHGLPRPLQLGEVEGNEGYLIRYLILIDPLPGLFNDRRLTATAYI